MKTQKVLFFDIENAPNTAYVWGKYEQNTLSYLNEGYLMSVAWKWLGEKTVHVKTLLDFKGYKAGTSDDEKLTNFVWDLLNEADVVVAHNGDSFDVKKMNAYFIKHHLKPCKPYATIDTKKIAKRIFRFNSNKLDDIGNYLGVGRKESTGGFELWLDCIAGKKEAWAKMARYNKQDVVLLENVYNRLKGWAVNLPVIHVAGCSTCGSNHVQCRGVRLTKKGLYQRYQCQECGTWTQSR